MVRLAESLELEMLARVLRLQMTEKLREELGQTYSPSASADQSRVYPGWGTLTIGASITPDDVEAARAAMVGVVSALRDAPISDDVLQRARAPLAETYDNLLKTNAGWMGFVDRAQTQPDRLQRYVDAAGIIGGITASDVQAMALRYLDPAQRLEIVVLPQEREAAPAQ